MTHGEHLSNEVLFSCLQSGGFYEKSISWPVPRPGQARQAGISPGRRLRRARLLLRREPFRQVRHPDLGHSGFRGLRLRAGHRRDRRQPAAACVRGDRCGQPKGRRSPALPPAARRAECRDDQLRLAGGHAFAPTALRKQLLPDPPFGP